MEKRRRAVRVEGKRGSTDGNREREAAVGQGGARRDL